MESVKQQQGVASIAEQLRAKGMVKAADSLMANSAAPSTGSISISDPAQPVRAGSISIANLSPDAIATSISMDDTQASAVLSVKNAPDRMLGPARLRTGQGLEAVRPTDWEDINIDVSGVTPNIDSPELYDAIPDWRNKLPEERSFLLGQAKQGTPLSTAVTQYNTMKQEKLQMSITENMFQSMGLSSVEEEGFMQVGVDGNGAPVYARPELANDVNVETGKQLADSLGSVMYAVGVFGNPKDLNQYSAISAQAADPEYHNRLTELYKNKNIEGFIGELGGIDRVGYVGASLFNKWGNLSPAQKSLAIATAKIQGYTFSNGAGIADTPVAEEFPDSPLFSVREAISLVGKGVNVVPMAKKWGQYLTLADGMLGRPESVDEIADAMQGIASLGFGASAQAVPVNQEQLAAMNATPSPNYGVGALRVGSGVITPQGYLAVRLMGEDKIIIPEENADTSVIDAPEVASRNAGEVYKNWSKNDVKQTEGVVGGSALVAGANKLGVFNPTAYGAAITESTYKNVKPWAYPGDLETVTKTAGVTLERLKNGLSNKEIDKKGVAYTTKGPLTKDTFGAVMTAMRREYANSGITSKEEAYQLSSQGYAEGRFTELDTVTHQRAADMVFDKAGYSVARRIVPGKNAGIRIALNKASGAK